MNNRRVLLKSYVWGHIVSNRLVSLLNSIKGKFKELTLSGNSVQGENPSPDNPQEIKSAGRKSKNLFNIADLRVGKVQKDGTINEKETLYRSVILDVPEDGKYRITFKTNTDYDMLYFTEAYTNGVYSTPFVRVFGAKSSSPIALKKGENILSFKTTKGDAQIDFSKDHNIMIAAESASLVYEPYSDKYLIDMKITGKNLIPNTVGFEVGSFNYNTGVNMSLPDRGRLKEYIPIAPGKKYLVTVNGNTSIDDIGVHFLDINRFPVAGHGTTRFISPPNAYYVRIRYKGWTENDKVSLQLQDTSLDYEPYTEQSVQISLDEPLRGIGEYKDTITKDGVARKIYEQTLKKERISMNEYNWDRKFFRLYVNYDKKIDSSTTIAGLFSNMFKRFDIYEGNPTIYWLISEEEIRSMGITEADSREVAYEKIKDFVTNNDIVVQYPIVETTLEPLSEFVQAQLSAFHSENGATHVFVDSGEVEAGISVTYKQKK